MAAEVIELPPLSKNTKTGDVYPAVLALHHKAGSAEVLAGTHGCDVWAVGARRTEPVIYGHSAYVNGLAFHPTKPAWFVTASEASRVFVWDAHKRCLLAKRNVHRCVPPPPPPIPAWPFVEQRGQHTVYHITSRCDESAASQPEPHGT